jgi:hypothetical protein
MTVKEQILITFSIKTEKLPKIRIVHLLFIEEGNANIKMKKSNVKSNPEQGVATYKTGTLFKDIRVFIKLA